MPHLSDRQKHANALLEAYILQTIIEAQESASVHDTDSTGSYWEMNSEKAGSDNGSDASSGWGMEIEDEWPSEAEIEEAKEWVEANSCPSWCEGWLMVDGTLIPMFQRPHHFGSAYFDHKSNYSENVQIINMPNLRIIDYGIGLPGRQRLMQKERQERMAWELEHAEALAAEEAGYGDGSDEAVNLLEGRIKREQLKELLFGYLRAE
ncbi:hypothetical protein CPB84DRAFT_1749869 [Gymnopilus junonius]|uniref:Uncharacterized protein n=1 Tax=Gymnopilus junonius TaxID=109634 RepID=A0A9P5NF65_GYMJU|nr:hypothetical protein CPB84DRAFT_1749869 [Gymnopilus junonius]